MLALGCTHSPGQAAQVLRYSARAQTQPGLYFVPFPGPSSSGDQVLGECSRPQLGAVAYRLPHPAARFSGCTMGAPSEVCHVSLLGS